MMSQMDFTAALSDCGVAWRFSGRGRPVPDASAFEYLFGDEPSPPLVWRLDCDNGGEFLNHPLLAYLHERKKPVA